MTLPKKSKKQPPEVPLHLRHLSAVLAKLSAPPKDGRHTAIVIVGPNGSGKSSIFEALRQDADPILFINADLIGKLLENAPGPEYLAQKFADTFREHVLSHTTTFATETVFSDEVGAKLAWLEQAAKANYRVVLIVVGLESANMSKARVAARVENGGHSVPVEKLARRYDACMKNCKAALQFVEVGIVVENSYDLSGTPFMPMAITSKGRVQWQAEELPAYINKLLPEEAPPTGDKIPKKRAKPRGK